MSGVRLSTLLAGAGVQPLDRLGADPLIAGVRVDSRRVGAGDLFVAVRGEKYDGAAFVTDAMVRGASAVLAETPPPPDLGALAWVRVSEARRATALLAREWFGRPDLAMTLVGITGTNGKTTVAYLVESIARAAGRPAGRVGTVAYAFGGREYRAERTTPEATELFELLARMRAAGTDLVAMEVSSHALALHRVAGARFEVAAFLNLGRDHLDFHGTIDAYFEAKAGLFDGLGPDDTAVLPADDARGDRLARRTRARILTFGRGPGAAVRWDEFSLGSDGSEAVFVTEDGRFAVRSPLLGRFNLDNVAAAVACGIACGIDREAIARGIAELRTVPGRLERVDCGQPFTVLVDYAHTEQALAGALEAARTVAAGRVGVVFGCGGERDRGKRPGMGRVAATAAERVWVTSDNPRGEEIETIALDILEGIDGVDGGRAKTVVERDRARAVEQAVAWAGTGDCVLVAGKGHETTQTIGERVAPFDDRDVARNALHRQGWGAR